MGCQVKKGDQWIKIDSQTWKENYIEKIDVRWFHFELSGAKIISAETVDIRTAGGQNSDPEVTYTYASGKFIKGYIIALRLYLDGAYNDPPPEALPPVPQIQATQESGCCTIL